MKARIMPLNLVDLSPELQLKIIDELLIDPRNEKGEDVGQDREDDPYDYNSEKPHESEERKERERQNYRVDVLMSWSSTSKFFRALLAPYIFKTVDLRNNDHSGVSATALAQSEHATYVKNLIYVGKAPGDAHKDEPEYSDTDGILPLSVGKLLSDLSCFPSLEKLSIEFLYPFSDYNEWDEGIEMGEYEESDEVVESEEEKVAWRALMAKTYEALIRNEKSNLKSLEVRQLVPIQVSTFKNAAFHKFLAHFERFSLSIYGMDNGAGWKINKYDQYTAIMGKLDVFFFDHLTSVTDFVLKAPEEGPLGLIGQSHAPLALRGDHMPSLRTLRLEYILVGPELSEFLIGLQNTLESIVMHKCSASISGLAENGISWDTFFDTLNDASFTKLKYLSITPHRAPLWDEESYWREEDPEKAPDDVKEAREILKNDPQRRLFSYITLDDKYGEIYDEEEENLEAFQRGKDQETYEKLMSRIQKNAQESKKK